MPEPSVLHRLLGAPTTWTGERQVSGELDASELRKLAAVCDTQTRRSGESTVVQGRLDWEWTDGLPQIRVAVLSGVDGTRIEGSGNLWPGGIDPYAPVALAAVALLVAVGFVGGAVGLAVAAVLLVVTWLTARPIWRRVSRRVERRLEGLMDGLAAEASRIATIGADSARNHP
jgi:hypothetical protein